MPAKTDRLNLRCSTATLATLREAAEIQDQDLTSFVLGAALDRARAVITESHALSLTPQEVLQLEKALEADGAVPQLAALLRSVRSVRSEHASSA